MEIYKELSRIQSELKAPKKQWNDFSKFNYRSCEDILEAVKPILNGLVLLLSDDVVEVSGRAYVKATAKLTNGSQFIENTALARESETKKGMDDSQITGAASSYARKYALNGLFAIDDEKDADSKDNRQYQAEQKNQDDVKWYNDFEKQKEMMKNKIMTGEQTPDGIINSLKMAGFKISNKVKEQIINLEKEING